MDFRVISPVSQDDEDKKRQWDVSDKLGDEARRSNRVSETLRRSVSS